MKTRMTTTAAALVAALAASFAFAEDPYLESDGTGGMSTGYRMNEHSRVEVDYALTDVNANQMRLFGDFSAGNEKSLQTMFYWTGTDGGTGGNYTFRIRAVGSANAHDCQWTGADAISVDLARRTLVADIKNGKCQIITGGVVSSKNFAYSSTYAADFAGKTASMPLSLFGEYANTNATAFTNGSNCRCSKARIYGVKIYEDYDESGENEPVHDFTPCLREGVACFRDEVTGMFITGENVDAFSVGGDYEEVDDDGYVSTVSESAAARLYIDTGHQVTDDTRVELDCAIATNMIGDVEWHIFDCNCVPRFVMDYASEALRYVAGGLEAAYAEKLDDSAFPRPTDKKEVRRTFILDNHVGMAAVVTSGFTNKTATFSHPTTTTSAGNLVLGAYYTGSACNAPLKIYGCKIYEGEELALDFVPCVKNGVGGLRDSMSGRFIAGSDALSNGNTLPYGGTIDVVEDPYILSKGTSGISTGYRMKGGVSRVEVDFALETVEGSGQTRIFGDTTKEASLGTMFYFTGSGTGAGFQFRNKVKGSFRFTTYDNGVAWGADLLRHTLVTDLGNGKNQIVTTNSTWTGSFAVSAFEGLTADMPLSLFARYDNTNATSFAEGSHARIYGVKIYEDYDESAEDNAAKLVHNFVPCYKVGADAADKVPCFRDLVTGRFIIGEDVSAFEGGGDIPDIADDPYVSTVSDTPGEYYYVDTGYRVKDTTRVELDCALASNMLGNAMWVLFDAFENTGDNSKRFRFYYNNPNLTYWVGTSGAIDATAFARPATGRDVRRTFVLDNVSQEAVVVTSTFTNKCVSMTRPGYNGTRTGNTLKLGCTYGDAWALGSSGLAPLKIYGCRIYESGVLVTNFTPYVLRGTAGLRDAVHKTGFVGGKVKTGSAAGVDASLSHGGDWDPYIESDGTSAISTGYRMNANSRVEVDFALSAADETGKWIFGTSSSQESSLRSGLLVDGTPAVFKFSTGTSSSGTAGDYANSAAIDSGRHTAIIDLRGRILVMETDGIQDYAKGIASVNFSGSTASLPLSLFGEWSNAAATAAANGAKARIYGARIYENGTIVHNYVPCWRDDDVPCFRDAIGGGFIAGENASAFETGGDAPVYTNDMYVSTVSAAGSKMYIDTGYEVTAGTRVELDCALATNMAGSATWRLFGSDAGTEFGFKYGASGLDWSARGLADQTQFRPAFPKPAAAAGTRRTFILDNANCEAAVVTRGFTNHVEAFAASGDGAAAKTLKIASAAAATADHAPLKVYGCRIFEGGELVRDFVPYAETDGGGTLVPVGLRDVLTGRLAWGGDASGNGNALVAGGGCEPCILSSGREHTGVSTGYRMKGGVSRIEVDFQLVKALLEGRVFGNDAGDGTRFRDAKLRTVLFVESKKKNFVFYTGTGAKVVAKDANNVRQYVPADLLRHTAIMDLVNDRNVLLTGGVTNFSASTGLDLGGLVSEMPLPLFNRFFNDEGTDFSTWPSCARIYGVKIYENDELVHDFVPYFDGFESGFRDSVTGEFATGYGTAYSDATARHTYRGSVYATDAYIESDGSAGFDTGYKMVGGVSRVEVDCELTAESQCSKYIFGSSTLESSLFTFFYTTATGYPTCRNGPSGQQNYHSAQWPVAHDVRRHTYVTDLRNGISAMTPCPANANLSSDLECKKSVGETAFAGAVADYPLPIFAMYATYDLATGAATWNSGARARVYSVRIYENYDASAADNSANLVHEFIPYKKGSVVGFYDTVTGEIKELSSAHFTYGGAGQDHGRFKSYVSPDHAAQLAHAGTKSTAPLTAYAPGAEAYRWYDKDGMVKGVSGDSLTVRYTRGGSVDEYWSVGWYGEDFGCGVKSAPEGVKSATKGFVQCFR